MSHEMREFAGELPHGSYDVEVHLFDMPKINFYGVIVFGDFMGDRFSNEYVCKSLPEAREEYTYYCKLYAGDLSSWEYRRA